MATANHQLLYVFDEDLYRIGNATSPKLDHVRSGEFQTYERNGVVMIRATGIGLSLGTLDYIEDIGLSGWLWKIPATTALKGYAKYDKR